jgi:UDPglucose 6-dehydrogenase
MATQSDKPTIGFIGHGYVGKSYADNFAERGYPTIRYALEEPWVENKEKVGTCDIVMIAVPTPTTPKGFSIGIVEEALGLVKPGAMAIIKSTMPPGMTRKLQKKFSKLVILFSPEFLSVATAAHDTSHPFATVIGLPVEDEKHRQAAERVLKILPYAPHQVICTSEEAEIYKYSHNVSGVMQILTFNLMYDIAQKLGCDWEKIQRAIEADPYIPNRYSTPVNKGGRGAGGGCFIKDLAAYRYFYETITKDKEGTAFLDAAEKMNLALLVSTNKDINLLEGVYGPAVVKRYKKKR